MLVHNRGPVIIYLILLIAFTFTLIVPQTFASPIAPGWAVQGTFTLSSYPCTTSENNTCTAYQVTGVAGPSCAFPNPNQNQLSEWPCNRAVYFGTWRLLFSCVYPNNSGCSAIPAPPSQPQQITAYGTVVQPSNAGGIYAGDLYVYSWYPTGTTAGTVANYGDQNVEQWAGTIGGNIVQAYLMFTVPGPTVIHSVSMYVQYSGSDGSQCMAFGVYLDNGNGSPAGQPLVAATRNTYCLHGAVTWGPAWETWKLQYDALALPAAGTYWLAVLAPQMYGNIYHYAYGSTYDYTYGYATYYFAAPYTQGFPIYFSGNPASEGNGPYSMYVTATS